MKAHPEVSSKNLFFRKDLVGLFQLNSYPFHSRLGDKVDGSRTFDKMGRPLRHSPPNQHCCLPPKHIFLLPQILDSRLCHRRNRKSKHFPRCASITHNLAFRGVRPNQAFAIFANLPIGVPFAMMFKRYHIEHHKVGFYEL